MPRVEPREGTVTVYDSDGKYVGCMGVETWRRLLADGAANRSWLCDMTHPGEPCPAEVATILDSPEVAALVTEIDGLRFTGRRGYGARAMLGACIVKALYALPTWTRVAILIAEHPGLSDALGGAPSHWACYRFARKLRATEREVLVDALAASLTVVSR